MTRAAFFALGFLFATSAAVPAAPSAPVVAAPAVRSLVLIGIVTNTTHDVSAPARLELTFTGEKIAGTLVTDAPLAGTYPITGESTGAWCELNARPTPDTLLQLRGALSASDYRGTYVFGGKNERVQYGQFQFKPAAPKSTPAPSPADAPAAR